MSKISKEEMISRYVYDVARRLPQGSRADIEKELKSNIYDMLEVRKPDGGYNKQDVKEVLMELGKPYDLAVSYKGQQRSLIAGVYYEQYCYILRVVLIAVALGMAVAQLISLATEPPGTLWEGVGIFVANMFMALIQGFAWVTIIFAIVEKCNVKLDKGSWTPSDLPPVPAQQAVIKKSDPIGGIVFIVIVMLLFNIAPQFFSIGMGIVYTGEMDAISFFSKDVLQSSLWMINICFVLGIIREVIRVVMGRYTIKLASIVTVLNAASLALILPALLNQALWNVQMVPQVIEAFKINEPTVSSALGLFPAIFVGIIVFAFILDTAISWYRAIRYGQGSNE